MTQEGLDGLEGVDKLDWIAPLLGDAGLLSVEVNVQMACLNALRGVLEGISKAKPSVKVTANIAAVREIMSKDKLVENRLWLAKFNEDEGVRTLAAQVWELRGETLGDDYGSVLLPLLSYPGPISVDGTPSDPSSGKHVRYAAARAISGSIKALPHTSESYTLQLKSLYHAKKPVAATSTGRALAPSGPGGALGGAVIGKGRDGKAMVAGAGVAVSMVDNHVATRLAVAEFIRAVGVDRAVPSEGSDERYAPCHILFMMFCS